MRRPFATLLIAAAACSIAVAAQQQAPVFRAGADTVRVFVTVTGRDGRLVTDLTQDKFEIRDEGKPQPITTFDNTPKPVQLIVMLDVSGSMEGNLPLLRAGARQLFARLGPDDVAKLGVFGNDITIGPEFTRDARALESGLPGAIDPTAGTPLWRALDQAMAAFDPASDRRRVVLVLSDGADSGPMLGKRFLSQGEVIIRARKDDVMVYGIGMRSRSSRGNAAMMGGGLSAAMQANEPDPALPRTALETGGGYTELRPRDDLGQAFARVIDELHSQYLLGFAPPKRDGKVHDINVKLSVGGLEPRARKNYVAPKG